MPYALCLFPFSFLLCASPIPRFTSFFLSAISYKHYVFTVDERDVVIQHSRQRHLLQSPLIKALGPFPGGDDKDRNWALLEDLLGNASDNGVLYSRSPVRAHNNDVRLVLYRTFNDFSIFPPGSGNNLKGNPVRYPSYIVLLVIGEQIVLKLLVNPFKVSLGI